MPERATAEAGALPMSVNAFKENSWWLQPLVYTITLFGAATYMGRRDEVLNGVVKEMTSVKTDVKTHDAQIADLKLVAAQQATRAESVNQAIAGLTKSSGDLVTLIAAQARDSSSIEELRRRIERLETQKDKP